MMLSIRVGVEAGRKSMQTGGLSRFARTFASSSAVLSEGTSTGAAPNPKDYFHNSPYNTFLFQASLPRLPVPKLDDTLDNYIRFVTPLVDADSLETTKKAVEEFRTGAGPKLQTSIVTRDSAHPETSYISAPWYDMYLKNRDSAPLNLTPELIWRDNPNPAKMEQVARATDFVVAATRFQRSLEAQVLEPDVFRMKGREPKWAEYLIANFVPERFAYYPLYYFEGYALDMSQYKNLFYSTRIPKIGKDELRVSSKRRHIIVQRGSRIYAVDVFDKELQPLGPEAIESQLRGIMAQESATTAAQGPAVGSLTTLDRDTWAHTRAVMELNTTNRNSLEMIDSAMFVLTLDDDESTDDAAVSRLMLHGDGRNRWFDKCFNLIVNAKGKAGITWEHAWGDGVAVLNFFNVVYGEVNSIPERPPANPSPVAELPFRLTDGVKDTIAAAEKRLATQVAECELEVYKTDALTKSDIKKSGLSPDGIMQMALQLAHWRTHGYIPSTYESASTAAFKHGRTETIRSASIEGAEMCKVFDDKSSSPAERHAALKAATERHAETTKLCVTGKGADRHLTALELEANSRGIPTPSIFTDESMQVYRDIRLSTSTLASPALAGGGFGPVSRHSYGVGYSTADEGCGFHMMSYQLETAGMCSNAESALREFKEVMDWKAKETPASE